MFVSVRTTLFTLLLRRGDFLEEQIIPERIDIGSSRSSAAGNRLTMALHPVLYHMSPNRAAAVATLELRQIFGNVFREQDVALSPSHDTARHMETGPATFVDP